MIEKLKKVIDEMHYLLCLVSGATDFQLKTCAYYAVATWHINVFDVFPTLALIGQTGTGKTVLMKAVGIFCYKPITINVEKSTPPVIREKFAEAISGTVLIEEYNTDSLSASEIENFIIARCGRATGLAAKMVRGGGDWTTKIYKTYGATIVHSRDHFKDSAMDNRSIILQLRNNTDRQDYFKMPTDQVNEVVTVLTQAQSIVLPELQQPQGISPRVTDVHAPILRIAQLLRDEDYLNELYTYLKIADASFREGQTYEPRALAMRGLIACLTGNTSSGDAVLKIRPIKTNDISEHLRRNYSRGLSPRQVCEYMRELKFTVKLSGGVNTVTDITVPQLSRACSEVGLNDELVAQAAEATI